MKTDFSGILCRATIAYSNDPFFFFLMEAGAKLKSA